MKKIIFAILFALSASQTHAAIVWTCTRDFVMPFSAGYLSMGQCSGDGGAYTTGGGDFLGASASVSDLGVAVCGSSTRVAKRVVVSNGSVSGSTTAVVTGYNLDTRKLQLFGTTVSATGTTQVTGSPTSGIVVNFFAICQ